MKESALIPDWVFAVMENAENFGSPILDPKLDPKKYQIDFNFGNARNWKAKIIVGNSMRRDKKKGQWDSVRYVMISLSTNTIIPIAISDEHHVGYDLLHHMGISTENYYSFDAWGTNYIHRDFETREFYQAAQKFIARGGNQNVSLVQYTQKRCLITLDHFMKCKGDVKRLDSIITQKEGKLTPVGKRLLAEWNELAKLAHLDPMVKSSIGRFYQKAKSVINDTYKITNMMLIDYTTASACERMLDELRDRGDFYAITNFVFGYLTTKDADYKRYHDLVPMVNDRIKREGIPFNGIHNFIHNEIRKMLQNEKNYNYPLCVSLIGDLNHFEKLWGVM